MSHEQSNCCDLLHLWHSLFVEGRSNTVRGAEHVSSLSSSLNLWMGNCVSGHNNWRFPCRHNSNWLWYQISLTSGKTVGCVVEPGTA